jgi:uncharacterized membrane protein YdjX (TVP38/TMEM64 family)/Fe-S oxidoreductase
LDTYGTPDKIITENPEKVFLCSNCEACDTVCKENLRPSEILFEMKGMLLKNGSLPLEVRDALTSAQGYALRGHRFPFSHYTSADIVFWPGCGVAGTSPELVKKTVQLLTNHLNKKVGLVLDCCFDPVYQLGDVDSVEDITKEIHDRLKKNKITHVITGCTNCRKTLYRYLPDIKVEHIFETLKNGAVNPSFIGNLPIPSLEKGGVGGFFLHHPCPSFNLDGLRQHVKTITRSTYGENLRPSCCGHGGGVSSLSQELSEKFTDKVIQSSNGSTVVTYCMGCKGKFLERGKKTYHLLELMTGVKPIEKPVSSGRKWVNRFVLASDQKFNVKKILIGLFIILSIVLTTYLRKQGYISTEGILDFIKQYKVAAPLLFILFYAIGPSLLIPSLPLTLGAGFLWGPFWGVIFSITGSTSGASVAFLISRYVMADTVRNRFGHDKWKWLEEKVDKHGWKAVAFARLLPVLPFPVLNYMFGVTPIPFLHYLWASFVFMLPACIAYVAFGSSMGELILKGNVKGLIIGIVVASLAMLLPFVLKPLVKKVSPPKDI